MKCVCSSAGITNTCHTTEESQAIVVTPPTGSLGFIRMLLLGLGLGLGISVISVKEAILTLGKCTAIPCRPVPNMGSDAVQLPSWWGTWVPVHYCIHIQCAYSKIRLSDCYWHEPIDCCGEGEHYTCTVKARSVGVWRQISDMASFWIRPEYVVDYRPILDAPVDAAGEVVEEIMLYCCWCILRFRISAIIAVLVALYFL